MKINLDNRIILSQWNEIKKMKQDNEINMNMKYDN